MKDTSKAPLLSVRNLTTVFATRKGEVKAVDDVSFDLGKNEVLGIVGENGSGKSVTALSILRLIPDPPGKIEEGEILFDGQDLLKLDDAGIVRLDEVTTVAVALPVCGPAYEVAESLHLDGLHVVEARFQTEVGE